MSSHGSIVHLPVHSNSKSTLSDLEIGIASDVAFLLTDSLKKKYNITVAGAERTIALDTSRVPGLKLDRVFGYAFMFSMQDSTLYRLFVLIEFNTNDLRICQRVTNLANIEVGFSELSLELEEHASKYAICLEEVDRANPRSEPKHIITFDSWPEFPNVDRFPHHYHIYNSKNKRLVPGRTFFGDLESIIEKMANEIKPKKVA